MSSASQHSKSMSDEIVARKVRTGYAIVSVFLFILAVSRWVQIHDVIYDRRHYVSFHDIQYGLILMSGVGLGIALGPSVIFGIRALLWNMRTISASDDISRALKSLAWGALAVGMIPSILWTVLSFNTFIDAHTGLVVEVDIIVLLMGFLTGVSWLVLLGRRVWLGAVISLTMILMLVGSVLTNYGW